MSDNTLQILQDQYESALSGALGQDVSTLLGTKTSNLIDSAEQKATRLAGPTTSLGLFDEYEGMSPTFKKTDKFGGTYDAQNKLFNEANAATKQEYFGTAYAKRGLVRDEESGLFYNPNENEENREYYNPQDVGIVYQGTTPSGDTKLGYVSNYNNSATPQEEVRRNYEHFKTTGLDSDPTGDDNMTALYFLDKDAKELEAFMHGNKETLDNRKWQLNDPNKPKRGTEVYSGDASSVWGDSRVGGKADENLVSGIKDLKQRSLLEGFREAQGPVDYAIDRATNTASSFYSAFTKELLVDTADWIGEATGAWNIGSDEEKTKMVNEWFNYDPENVEEAQKKVGALTNVIFDKNVSTSAKLSAIGEAAWTAFKTPEMLGQSLGVLASWLIPGSLLTKGSKLSKLSKIDKLVEAGKLSKTAGLAQKAKVLTTTKDGLQYALKKESGQLLAAAGNVNDQYEEFVKNNNGQELTGADKALWFTKAFGVQMLNQKLDQVTDVSILKSPQLLAAAKNSIADISQKNFGSFLTNVGKTVSSLAFKEMPKEAAQEYTQEMMEMYNARYGSEKFKDQDSFIKFVTDPEQVKQATEAALMGAGGAGQFRLAGSIPNIVGTGTELTKSALGIKPDSDPKNVPFTAAGRADLFYADEDTQKAVATERGKDIYTNAIVQHAATLFADPEEAQKSPYGELDPTERVQKILDDTVSKLSLVNDISTPEGQEIVKAIATETIRNQLNNSTNATSEQKDSILKSILTTYGTNPHVAREIQIGFEDELRNSLQDFIDKAGDNIDSVDLTPEEISNIKAITKRMKTMGSEPLETEANDIEDILLSRRDDNGKVPPNRRKTAVEVREEIRKLGFLTKGKARKSLESHNLDIEGDILRGQDRGNASVLNDFVESRTIDKINPYRTEDNGNVVPRSRAELNSFINYVQNDNQEIKKTITGLLQKDNIPEDIKEQLEKSLEKINKTIEEIQNLTSTPKDKDFYKKILEATRPDLDVDKFMSDLAKNGTRKPKSTSQTSTEQSIDGNDFYGFDSTKTYTKEEIKDLVVDMLTNPKKYPDSPTKFQFISNNIKSINEISKEMQKSTNEPEVVTDEEAEAAMAPDEIIIPDEDIKIQEETQESSKTKENSKYYEKGYETKTPREADGIRQALEKNVGPEALQEFNEGFEAGQEERLAAYKAKKAKTEQKEKIKPTKFTEEDQNPYQTARDGEFPSEYQMVKEGAGNRPVKQPTKPKPSPKEEPKTTTKEDIKQKDDIISTIESVYRNAPKPIRDLLLQIIRKAAGNKEATFRSALKTISEDC